MAYKDWKDTHFYAAASGRTSNPDSGVRDVGAVTRSRAEAVAFEGAGDADYITREHAVDPMVDRAASELVELDDKGQRVAIEIKGRPYDVLQDILAEFARLGASSFVTQQVLHALQKFTLHEGTNFSKAAEARPLYARIEVTAAKPDDLPECEKFQYTFLDGVRRRGRDASTMGNIRPTIHGTQSSQSSVPGMDEMFESVKQKGLLVFFASMDADELNSFDNTDNDLVSGLQAFIDGGGTDAVIDQIEQLMLDGDVSPEAMELIEALAEYQTVLIDAQTPDAVENAAEVIEALETKIETALSDGVDLPDEITAVIEQRFEYLSSETNDYLVDFDNSGNIDILLSENNLDEGAEIAALVEKLETAIEGGDIQVIEKALGGIEIILETSEALPADIKQRLETVISKAHSDILDMELANSAPDSSIAQLAEKLDAVAALDQGETVTDDADISAKQEIISSIEAILETSETLPVEVKERLEAVIGKAGSDSAISNSALESSAPQLPERLEAIAQAARDLPVAESNVIDAREIFQQVASAETAQGMATQTLDIQQDNVQLAAADILAPDETGLESSMQEIARETTQEILSEQTADATQEQKTERASEITEDALCADIMSADTVNADKASANIGGENIVEGTLDKARPAKAESALAKLQALKSQSPVSAPRAPTPSSSSTPASSKIIVSPAIGVQTVRPSAPASKAQNSAAPAKPNYQAPSVRVQTGQPQMPIHAPAVQVAPAKNVQPQNEPAQNNPAQHTKPNIISAAQPSSQPQDLKQAEKKNIIQSAKNENSDYQAMKSEAEFENKEEKMNVTGCDGCTHKDCANCSKFANLNKFDNDMQDVKREMAEMGMSVSDTQEAQPVKVYETQIIYKHVEDSLKPEEKANVSGCDGCTHKDCANCSKFANLSKFDNDMQDVKREMAAMGYSLAA